MNKLDQLKKKIQEAVPEIMELKFGCEVIEKINGKKSISKLDSWYIDQSKIGQENFNFTEILGRPIVWDDIALTLESDMNWFITRQGRFFYKGDEVAIWEWGKPLDQQPEETIDFLWEVICKN